jgi:hypothetical protein
MLINTILAMTITLDDRVTTITWATMMIIPVVGNLTITPVNWLTIWQATSGHHSYLINTVYWAPLSLLGNRLTLCWPPPGKHSSGKLLTSIQYTGYQDDGYTGHKSGNIGLANIRSSGQCYG